VGAAGRAGRCCSTRRLPKLSWGGRGAPSSIGSSSSDNGSSAVEERAVLSRGAGGILAAGGASSWVVVEGSPWTL
jgi:hypothetical protein